MADSHMPEEFFETVARHLPPEQPVAPRAAGPGSATGSSSG